MTATSDASVDDVVMESLTDEELAVLGGPRSIVVNPYLDERNIGQGSPELEPLVRTAYRGLLARGIVDPPTAEAIIAAGDDRAKGHLGDDPAGIDLMVRSDVLTAVTLRRTASAVVMVARTTATAQDFWYAHVNEDVCLIEQVSRDGIHRFALSRTSLLPERLVAAVIHPEAGDAGTGPIPLGDSGDGPPLELLEVLGRAFVRADLVVRRAGDSDPELIGVFSGPAGCWYVPAGAAGAAIDLVAHPATVAELQSIVVGRLSGIGATSAAAEGYDS